MYERGYIPTPEWSISPEYLVEDKIPSKGIVRLEYYGGDGVQVLGAKPDHTLRNLLMCLVLIKPQDFLLEDGMVSLPIAVQQAANAFHAIKEEKLEGIENKLVKKIGKILRRQPPVPVPIALPAIVAMTLPTSDTFDKKKHIEESLVAARMMFCTKDLTGWLQRFKIQWNYNSSVEK